MAHHTHALVEGWFSRNHTVPEIMQRMLEDPWIVKSAPADADPGAPGFFKHFPGSRGCKNIAVAHDGNLLYGSDHFANAGQINRAGKPLFPGPAMDKNCGHAGILQRPRQIRRGDV